jgi:hypothetical protein
MQLARRPPTLAPADDAQMPTQLRPVADRPGIDPGACCVAVAEENLELARRIIELGRRRDRRQLDMLAPDVRYVPIAEVTEAGEYHGP